MNVLIIIPPYTGRPVDYYNLPLGLLYVATAVRKQAEVSILNFNEVLFSDHERVIKYRLNDVDMVLVGGLSVHYNFIKRIVNTVKKYKDVPVVVGGGLVTSQPAVIDKCLGADHLISGEADNINFSSLGKITRGNTVHSEDLNNIIPAYDLFNMELYLNLQRPSDSHYRAVTDHPRELAIIASRGCPYQCTFCFHPTGNTYRQRSLDSVFSEIEMLKENYNINIIAVYDELFAASKPRLVEFCERIKKLNLHWSCQLRVDSVDADTLKMLKDSGCYIISFGIESASDKILRNYKKNITVKQINNALEWSKQAGIAVQGNIILGAEEETIETATESLKWWNDHRPYHLSIGPVIPYPGTAMYEKMISDGKIDPVEFLENGCPAISCSKLSQEDYLKLMGKYYTGFEVVPAYDFRYSKELDAFGRVKLQFKTNCPYCGHEQTRKNFAMDMVGNGIKYCERCAMRYFIKGEN